MADAPLFTPPEHANMIAAQAVAAATSFLEGRSDASHLARAASRVYDDLLLIKHDPRASVIVDATRLMVTAMIHTSLTTNARGKRWGAVMAAFIPLLRYESTDLAATGAQRQ